MPSACSICASIWRASSVNSTSPSATLAPSSKCTRRMVVSSRDFSATLEIGVTVPMASTSTGTGLRSALAISTDMVRGRWGPWALALPPIHDDRVMKAAPATMPSAPAISIQFRFFIVLVCAGPQRPDQRFQPLDCVFCALFVNGYHSLMTHGMPLIENLRLRFLHAHCDLE